MGNNKKETSESIAITEQLYSPFLEPLLDQICASINIKEEPASPFKKSMSKEEIRKELRKFLSDLLYDKNERGKIGRGCEVIIENFSRISEKSLVEKELLGAGSKLIDDFLIKFKEICGEKEDFSEPWEKMQSVWKEKYIENLKDKQPKENVTSDTTIEIETMRQQFGISETSFAAMYSICNQLYQENNIEDALSALQFLSILDVTSSTVWFSIGLCFQKQKKWPEAISNYSMSISTNIANIQAFLYTAECYLRMKDYENVNYTLELAKNILKQISLPENEKAQFEQYIKNLKVI